MRLILCNAKLKLSLTFVYRLVDWYLLRAVTRKA